MSDRIAVMRQGRIAQIGTPNEIYRAPNSRFVSEFMGEVNSFAVSRAPGGELVAAKSGIRIRAPQALPEDFRQGVLVVRPEDMVFLPNGSGPGGAEPESAARIEGTIANEYVLGSRVQYQVRAGEEIYLVEKISDAASAERLGDPVQIGWKPGSSMIFPE